MLALVPWVVYVVAQVATGGRLGDLSRHNRAVMRVHSTGVTSRSMPAPSRRFSRRSRAPATCCSPSSTACARTSDAYSAPPELLVGHRLRRRHRRGELDATLPAARVVVPGRQLRTALAAAMIERAPRRSASGLRGVSGPEDERACGRRGMDGGDRRRPSSASGRSCSTSWAARRRPDAAGRQPAKPPSTTWRSIAALARTRSPPSSTLIAGANTRAMPSAPCRTVRFDLWIDGGAPRLPRRSPASPPASLRVGPVYTPPEHRNRGYGRRLTYEVTATALARAGRDAAPCSSPMQPILSRTRSTGRRGTSLATGTSRSSSPSERRARA